MTGSRSVVRRLTVLALAITWVAGWLHYPALADDAGKRDFPATLVVEEPQVETEVAPQVAESRINNARRTDLSSELSLQLAKPLAVLVGPTYTILRPGGSGFQALSIGAKYQFVANAEHEIVFSAGVSSTLGGTGSGEIGADTYSSIIPTIFYGKGAGDLPDGLRWARPFAVTGQVGIIAPTRARSRETVPGLGPESLLDANPFVLALLGSVQYSLPYAAEHVFEDAVPSAFAALVPLVEYDIEVPVANTGSHASTIGTVDPGFLLVDAKRNITWGLEALIPINRASSTHPGARVQLSYSFATPYPLVGEAPH